MAFFLRVAVWFCIGGSIAILARVVRENPELANPIWLAGGLLFGAVILAVASPHATNNLVRKHLLSPRGAFLSPQTVEVTSAALVVNSATGRTEVPWSGVLAREEDAANIYLFIDELQALVLPRGAIAPLLSELNAKTSHLGNVA